MSKLKCTVCGNKLLEFNAFNIKHKFIYGSKYDGDVLNICLCPDCLDNLVDNIKSNSKVDPIIESRWSSN
jgi:hypothetical protein